MRTKFLLALVAFIALGGALLIISGSHRSETHVASAATGGPEMVLNIKGGDCDDPNLPTSCNASSGTEFTLSVDAVTIPAGGYAAFAALINYDSLTYMPTAFESEIVWPDFVQGAKEEPAANHIRLLALSGYSVPLPASTFVGNIAEVRLRCPIGPTQTIVQLLPYDEISQPLGSGFADSDLGLIFVKPGTLTINCGGTPTPCSPEGCPTPTSTATPSSTPTPTITPTPTVTPTPTATGTPYPSPVYITYHWKIDVFGDGTGSCDNIYDNQVGTTAQIASTCHAEPLSERSLGSGTVQYNPENGAYHSGPGSDGAPCPGLTADGVVSQDGQLFSGTWECGPFEGTFVGHRQGDLDGILDVFDPLPSVDSDDFVGPSMFGTIIDRGDQKVFVTNGLLPDVVHVVAIGSGSPATVEVCSDPVITLVLENQARVAGTCGSATVETVVGPVPVFFGTLAALVAEGVTVHADESPSGCYDLENALASQSSVILGGLTLDPGESVACVFDSDADGLADTVETNTGTFAGPGDTGTDPQVPDADGDGLSDGVEILIQGTDPFDADSDSDGCTDGRETGGNPALGGLRDPLNPWDFYDVLGPGAALPKDGIIDLPNDILGVILHFSPQGQAPYDAQFDRGPSSGPNPWNMTAPDGVIDLPNDILGVILQFNHRCV